MLKVMVFIERNLNEDLTMEDFAILVSEEVRGNSEVGTQVLKGGKYAIFTHQGPYGEMENAFNKIFLK